MTIDQETKLAKSYTRITAISEFMEMIARVSDLKYKADGNMILSEKIIEVLRVILPIIGADAVEPNPGGPEDESESDEDY